nr:tyrosine-type recombinase/integrase [Agrococcus sp. KRD186]
MAEVARTGGYEWKLSRSGHPNDALNEVFRPVQEQFEAWLDRQQLAVSTKNLYATVARTALGWLPVRGVTDISDLSGADMAGAVVFLSGSYRPGSMRTVVTALRVLCRFLEDSGRCTGLSRAVPRRVFRRVGTVRVLTAERIEELTNAPDLSAPAGLRDRAMLLLAARTGLRPIDIAGLRLRDIDWRQGLITVVQHKTGTSLTLPLLTDVGDAIADYLLRGRPAGAVDDHVFLRALAPFTALSPSSSLYYVAA